LTQLVKKSKEWSWKKHTFPIRNQRAANGDPPAEKGPSFGIGSLLKYYQILASQDFSLTLQVLAKRKLNRQKTTSNYLYSITMIYI
jgi:hypothetical protein